MKNLPVTEKMTRTTLSSEVVRPPQTFKDVDQIVRAFNKVFGQLNEIGKGLQ